MGTLIRFPEQALGMRLEARGGSGREPATVIILPVVRIERYGGEPGADAEPATGAPSRPGRKRRGRVSRS
jgi:hypothetical protein